MIELLKMGIVSAHNWPALPWWASFVGKSESGSVALRVGCVCFEVTVTEGVEKGTV